MSGRAGGLTVSGPGLSPASGDALYLRRFTTIGGLPVETARVRTQVNGAAVTEAVLENPNGPVQSLLPANANALGFLENGDGARFGNRASVSRIGNTPVFKFIRAEGSYSAPTAPLSGANLGSLAFRPFTDLANGSQVAAAIESVARENIGAAAIGALIRFFAGRVGTASRDVIVDMRSGGVGISEVVGGTSTWRLIPLTTGQLRNPANTVTQLEWNATGLGFFGIAPIARPTVTGAKGGNAALTSLCTQLAALGLIIDSTT